MTLAGCGSMPTAPVMTSARLAAGNATEAAAPIKTPADPGDHGPDGTTPGAGSPTVPAAGVATTVLTSFAAHPAARAVTSQGADLSSAGGSLVNGRWRVDVPAGALRAAAHVTLSVPGSRGAACQVQVEPANALVGTLTLTVDCHGQPANKIPQWGMVAYDATSASWSAVAGSKGDKKQHVVSASGVPAGVYGVATSNGAPAW
jgi:hypothetical protein